MPAIDSTSMGDSARFLPLDALDRALESMPASPKDHGRVARLFRRVEGGRRETLGEARLTPEAGVPGDAWERDPKRVAGKQIATMEWRIAERIANGQSPALFGDCLFLDLDLSRENLPTGSRLRAGPVLLEVTPEPHDGCVKFRGRFGGDALRFVARRETRHRNLRGIFLRVIEAGTVRAGDPVTVVRRPG